MDLAPWCYKWRDWIGIGWESLGDVRYRAPYSANQVFIMLQSLKVWMDDRSFLLLCFYSISKKVDLLLKMGEVDIEQIFPNRPDQSEAIWKMGKNHSIS